MAGVERAMVGRDVKAAKLAMKVVCMYTEHMFVNRATLTESAWEKTMDSGKKILRKSQHEPETRLVKSRIRGWFDLTAMKEVSRKFVRCLGRSCDVFCKSFTGAERTVFRWLRERKRGTHCFFVRLNGLKSCQFDEGSRAAE